MSDGMFPQHPRSGDWETLKGKMLAPHELPYSEQDTNYNDGRVDSQSATGVTTPWSHSIVSTPLTKGGGTLAK